MVQILYEDGRESTKIHDELVSMNFFTILTPTRASTPLKGHLMISTILMSTTTRARTPLEGNWMKIFTTCTTLKSRMKILSIMMPTPGARTVLNATRPRV